MPITVKHTKVSTIPDAGDSDLVRPSDWNADHTLIGLGTAAELDAGVPNGVATLDAGGKVPVSELPAAVIGALSYQGTWNASTNTPTLTSSTGTKGYYYVVSVAGNTNLDGVTDWQIGDWAVYNGTVWQKVDNTDAGGDVVGPASSTDNAVARFDSTTGKLLQNSLVIIGDTGSVTGVNALTAESLTVNNNATLGSSNTDSLDVRARISSDLDPETNNAKDIGSNGRNWRDGFFGRTVHTVNLELTGTTSFDGSQGTSGQVLTSAGTGNTPTWTTPTTGTVTSVGGTGTVSGISLSGTVTSSGNLTLGGALDLSSPPAIGGTTPAAGNFTTLGATGVATFSAGTVSAPAITTTGDTNTGIFFPAADTIAFTEGGVESMRIDSAGNLGLGVTPSAWDAGFKVIESLNGNSYYATSGASALGSNAFFSGGGWVYKTTAGASLYANAQGINQWLTAPSGTAGNAITFSEKMRLDINGNLGIGTTSPTAKLHVSSTTGSTDNGLNNASLFLNTGNESTTANLIRFNGAIVQALSFGRAINSDSFVWNGTSAGELMRLTSGGNLGIGTSSPSQKLQINDAGNVTIQLTKTGVASFGITNNGTSGTVLNVEAVPLIFNTSNTERMRITSAGDVGIGGTPSVGTLTLTGKYLLCSDSQSFFGDNGLISGSAADGNTRINYFGGKYFVITQGGSERMRIDSSGNVGIGTSSPNQTGFTAPVLSVTNGISGVLELIGTQASDGTVGQIAWYNTSGSTRTSQILGLRSGANNSGAITFQTSNAGTLAERMRIDSSGNLLLGTTSLISSGKQTVSYDGVANNGLVLSESANTSGTGYVIFNQGSTIIGSISRVAATSAVVYNTTSDERLKSNIVDANPVLDKLMDVKVRQFDWTKGDLHQDAGFIAQELAPVLSGIVTQGKTKEDMWQMDYARLTPYLVKAIQEQQALINNLTTRLNALEGK
jgi:hypothetical protein